MQLPVPRFEVQDQVPPSGPALAARIPYSPQGHRNSAPFHPVRGNVYVNGQDNRYSARTMMSPSSTPARYNGPHIGRSDWRQQDEVKIKFSDAPPHITTQAIWKAFNRYGHVAFIELLNDDAGNRNGSGYVRFSPPPKQEFWQRGELPVVFSPDSAPYTIKLRFIPSERRDARYKAPVNNREYPEKMALQVASLSFGYMHSVHDMKPLHTAKPIISQNMDIKLVQDLRFRNIEIFFPIAVRANEIYQFRLCFSHASKFEVFQPTSSIPKQALLVFTLRSPPELAIKFDGAESHSVDARTWNQNKQWYRHSNIVRNTTSASSCPTSLNVLDAIIDVGRWTTYSLAFDLSGQHRASFEQFCHALHDFNIKLDGNPKFRFIGDNVKTVWEILDRPVEPNQAHSTSLAAMMDQDVVTLPFEIRYQLEACISDGYLSEYTITRHFVDRLMSMDQLKAIELLEDVSALEKRFYDPLQIFEYRGFLRKKPKKQKLPHFCTIMRSAIITPTTIHPSTPTVEISNRVIRQYSSLAGNFLRVKFTEEKPRGQLYGRSNMKYIYKRIQDTLSHGITIGDRHFVFLAFGNSQLREHGAYFYSPVAHISADRIRSWMGDFDDIRQIAKYAARLGQCFSTTRAIHGARAQLDELPDVMSENGKHNFTDGVGKISKALATIAAREMGLGLSEDEPPSVLQFRLGGCKGVLAVWPQPNDYLKIYVRPSQYKFHAQYEGLEVIRWSQFTSAHLNQQLIAVLSTLGVRDSVFIDKLKRQIFILAEAMSNEKIAVKLLTSDVDPNQMTPVLAGMVQDGFQHHKDPFMISLLRLWRAWNIKYLKEKAKIAIPEGAVLLGCTDEAKVLKGHFDALQPKSDHFTPQEQFDAAPEIFVQLSKGLDGKPQVIEGYMLLARNPSLHPGDIRVVRGVNKKELRHLKDVVVLPQTGDRDIASMCSGGDLDGDDFLVVWDHDLLPRIRNYAPMDYTPPQPIIKPTGVTINDVAKFFVEYMRNDMLPTIAVTHRAQADANDDGVMNPKCLQLAQLHSKAVDFPKSGVSANMGDHLRPRKYPHFMERRPDRTYKSTKVLGKLYDEVELVKFEPDYDHPFDSRILGRYLLSDDLLAQAAEVKEQYDAAVLRIMQQHDIATEFEVWATFVLEHIKEGSDFKFHETIGHLSSALKETYRDECVDRAGGREMSKIGPFVAAMYQVTYGDLLRYKENEQQVGVGVAYERDRAIPRSQAEPMISFPWLFHDVLGRLAVGELDDPATNASTRGPIPIDTAVARKKPTQEDLVADEDVLETKEGVMHHGDKLVLFTRQEPHHITTTGRLIDVDDELDLDRINKYQDDSNFIEMPSSFPAPIPEPPTEPGGAKDSIQVPGRDKVEKWLETVSEGADEDVSSSGKEGKLAGTVGNIAGNSQDDDTGGAVEQVRLPTRKQGGLLGSLASLHM